MQKLYLSSKSNELGWYFLYRSPWIKVVSLGATVVMFLSSVSSVFATNQSQGFVQGSGAYAKNQQDTAIGNKAQAVGDGATAVGYSSQALQQNSTAVGRYAKALGHGGTAIGTSATTMTGHNSATTLDTAIGYNAKSFVWGGVALGSDSKADVEGGITGYDPGRGVASMETSLIWRSTRGAVSIGDPKSNITRQITGIAAGTEDTDVVNVAQLKALREWMEKESGTWKLSVSRKNTAQVYNKHGLDLAEGKNIRHVADRTLSMRSKDAVNNMQFYTLNNNIARYLGGGAIVREDGFFGPQYTLSSVSTDGIVRQAVFYNVGDALRELDVNVRNVNNHLKYVSGNFTEAIDKISKDLKHNTVSWNKRDKAFVALHTENGKRKNSKITFLADGDITHNSTDAVTGKQLWKTNERVKSLEDKVDNVSNQVNTLTDGVVSYDKDEQGNKINSITLVGGKEDEPVLIDNVADGEIEEGSKQAVNGGQLKKQMGVAFADANKYTDEKIENMVGAAFTQANAYADMKFNALSYKIDVVQKEARQAAAIGLAVASLHYINTPGTLSIAFGSGVWRGQSALAFGTGYMSEDGTVCSNFSVTTSGGHWGVGAGLSLALK